MHNIIATNHSMMLLGHVIAEPSAYFMRIIIGLQW